MAPLITSLLVLFSLTVLLSLLVLLSLCLRPIPAIVQLQELPQYSRPRPRLDAHRPTVSAAGQWCVGNTPLLVACPTLGSCRGGSSSLFSLPPPRLPSAIIIHDLLPRGTSSWFNRPGPRAHQATLSLTNACHSALYFKSVHAKTIAFMLVCTGF